LLILSFLSPSGQFGLMSDVLPKIVNGNFLNIVLNVTQLNNQITTGLFSYAD
jgi:hypothetical protein